MNRTTNVLLFIAKWIVYVIASVVGVLIYGLLLLWMLIDKILTAINNKLNKDEDEREDD